MAEESPNRHMNMACPQCGGWDIEHEPSFGMSTANYSYMCTNCQYQWWRTYKLDPAQSRLEWTRSSVDTEGMEDCCIQAAEGRGKHRIICRECKKIWKRTQGGYVRI